MNKKTDEMFSNLKKQFEYNEALIQKLRAENTKLKDEAYKDKELTRLKEQLDDVIQDSLRGFPVTKEESEAIAKWTNSHDEQVHNNKLSGAIGGRYKYTFIPTSIGTYASVFCTCGAEFCFRNLD